MSAKKSILKLNIFCNELDAQNNDHQSTYELRKDIGEDGWNEYMLFDDESDYNPGVLLHECNDYQEMVKFAKQISKQQPDCTFEVMDFNTEGYVHLLGGKVEYYTSCMGINDSYLYTQWKCDGVRPQEEEHENARYSVFDVYTTRELL